MRYNFKANNAKENIIKYIRDWFNKYDPSGKSYAIIGISGGKDSTVVAGLCCEALGKDRVIGVLLPQGVQSDINVSKEVCKYLGIKSYEINIGTATTALEDVVYHAFGSITMQMRTNMPPRIRMTALYAVAQVLNGFVINTSNLSEDWIGWATVGGDTMGAFGPISGFTCTEVIEIGKSLGLPNHLVEKAPSDGLTGKSDEDNFGFTYAVLDKYIRTGVCENEAIKKEIDYKHNRNLFKLRPMDVMVPNISNLYEDITTKESENIPFFTDERFF